MRGRPPAQHGTAGRYKSKKYGCRCDACKAAMSAENEARKADRKKKTEDPNDPRHGSRSFYTNYGCRCERCKAANDDYFFGRKQDG